jgi:hypothetical protein
MILNPAHPGEVLRDYPGEMTVAEAATRLGVTHVHLFSACSLTRQVSRSTGITCFIGM